MLISANTFRKAKDAALMALDGSPPVMNVSLSHRIYGKDCSMGGTEAERSSHCFEDCDDVLGCGTPLNFVAIKD